MITNPTLRLITAVLLFIAAALSILLPFVSATALTIAIGGVAIAAGVAQLLRLTGEGELNAKLFRGLSGLFYLAGGAWILAYPVDSEVSLTLLAGLLLVFEGVMELAGAAAGSGQARGLVIVDGVVTAILGGMLVAEWPSDSFWAIGTLFGVALFFSAINLITAPKAPAA
ncbi:HdeD family acid-resistance protein [Cyanobium sp. Morenito 9A2]|uniref:HdeD family acid-resistance protein n=1 Tax=Cyanobium sp. Morenito 9A2 TaxID=2823718 RepID=UPI0020CC451C|nr:DUF308 domain-containing protein [Cyanobium sp. Morenito 9A2]MCP9848550.1 DUF308 domain-containing protein [Cyanobium sp. Morenito 9A2]